MLTLPIRTLLAGSALATAAVAPVAPAQIAVLSSTVEERVASVGGRYTGTIVIANPGTEPQVARVYQTDYLFAADGTSRFDDPGTVGRSNAAWITPPAARVTIPPQSQVTVTYAVAVPANDSLRGTYWSTIMVEAAPTNASAVDTTRSMGIGSVMRYAVQVATHIGSTGTREVDFREATIGKSDSGTTTLDVVVVDVGERGYRPNLWVEVYDEAGALKAQGKQQRGLLYPGTSLRQHFDLGRLPAGKYKALLFADTGDDVVIATQFNITI